MYQDYDEVPLTLKANINEEQAKLAGLSAADIAQATQMGFSGLTASVLPEGDLVEGSGGGVAGVRKHSACRASESRVPASTMRTVSALRQGATTGCWPVARSEHRTPTGVLRCEEWVIMFRGSPC